MFGWSTRPLPVSAEERHLFAEILREDVWLRAPAVVARAVDQVPHVAKLGRPLATVTSVRRAELDLRGWVGVRGFRTHLDTIPVLERLDAAILMLGYRPAYVSQRTRINPRRLTWFRHHSARRPRYDDAVALARLFEFDVETFWRDTPIRAVRRQGVA